MKRDTLSYVLVYDEEVQDQATLAGVWCGSYPRGNAESIGLLIRQGLAGFTLSATWRDLADQLEQSGFQKLSVGVDEVLRTVHDVVRVVFLRGGQIRCQWFTEGPNDNADNGRPVGVIPSSSRRN